MSNALTPEIIQERIKKIPEWELNEDSISRSFEFDEYQFAIDFVNTIAEIAEEAQHHPDISIGWGYCLIMIHTHAIKGLSKNDFILASKIDLIEIN